MRVLVGCESSGAVRRAFRAVGHFFTYSCDLLPADDGSPFHYQCDIREVLKLRWDLAIFHPPCTYLCSSGLHWNNKRPERAQQTEEALEFVRLLMNSGIPKWALENPKGCIGTRIRPADQIIQPYEFGDDAAKGTCLWLHNLKPLVIDPSQRRPGRKVWHNGKQVERWANQTDSGQNALGPSDDRWKLRSVTYPGIAKAFAENWGKKLA